MNENVVATRLRLNETKAFLAVVKFYGILGVLEDPNFMLTDLRE